MTTKEANTRIKASPYTLAGRTYYQLSYLFEGAWHVYPGAFIDASQARRIGREVVNAL